jgi:3-oxoacyl-[acyl-carrier protein] reductase
VVKKSMNGKKCLVTGASRGIGKSIVRRLLEDDAIVVATASTDEGLNNLAVQFSKFGDRLVVLKADLSIPTEVESLCQAVSVAVGAIDVLINNAGVLYLESLENCNEELLRKSFEVNFFSALALSKYFSPAMVKNGYGSIINMCSSSAYTGGGSPGHCIYAATKHALLGFSRALDEELRSHNIRVGTISPAGVSTDMMGGRVDLDHSTFMTADDVADSVMFMLYGDGPGIIYEMRMWRKDR